MSWNNWSRVCEWEDVAPNCEECFEKATVFVEWHYKAPVYVAKLKRSLCDKHAKNYSINEDARFLSENEIKMIWALE